MTAQQPPHAPLRLLIAENSENAAHRFDSLLRDAGIATRPEIIDLPMAMDALSNADMMLCNAALPNLDSVLPQLRQKAPHVPIIIINNDEATLNTAEVMEMGAADAVAGCRASAEAVNRRGSHLFIGLFSFRGALRQVQRGYCCFEAHSLQQ